jgi:putative membrane protein
MRVDRFLRAEDLAAVETAVRHAEAASGGEIVPYVVDASDAYPGAAWMAAALGAVAAPLAAAGLVAWLDLWGVWPLWMTLPPLAGAGVGWLAARWVEPWRRALVPAPVAERRVAQRAAAAFLDEEVFLTRERTGILLFVSLFEHRVVVLADAGINRRVPPGAWDEVVADTVAGLRAGRHGAALAAAVTSLGELLVEHGVPLAPDDADELANRVRREER